MAAYVKKPIIIQAVQFRPSDFKSDEFEEMMPEWFTKALGESILVMEEDNEEKTLYLLVETLEGTMRCNPMDYIIQGVKGELYPCKKEIFQETYELAF